VYFEIDLSVSRDPHPRYALMFYLWYCLYLNSCSLYVSSVCLSLSDLPLVSCIFSCFLSEPKSECSDMTAYLLLLYYDHSPEYALHSARIMFSWTSRIFDCVCIVTCCVTLSSFLDLKVLALALFSIVDLSLCAFTSYRLSWHDERWVLFGLTVSNALASLLPLVSGRWEY
jgi:hypothetical protein